jgi:hypothetical protein
MTEIEYIDAMAALNQESRELKAAHRTQMELIEARHRDNINNETDRYLIEQRRQRAEYATKKEDLEQRKTETKRQRAASRAEEEKAAAALGCPPEAMS